MESQNFYTDLVSKYGSVAATARALTMSRSTLRDRIEREKMRSESPFSKTVTSATNSLSMQELPSSLPTIEEILRRAETDFEQKRGAEDATEWFEIKVHDNKPFGLMIWGDPHLDSPGCNIPLLRHHIAIAKHPGVFSINIGDTLDGWVGRLTRIYAESNISVHNARELAKWFLGEVRWLLWLAGNHDMWADNEAILRLMSGQADVRCLPWAAKFRMTFPNGNELRVHAAHDFPGRSMHNIVHGNMRAARFMSNADLFLSGHLHDWGSSVFEMAGFNRAPHSVRVRGYKHMDSYAVTNGYQSSRHGSSCLIMIDPNVEGPGRTTVFWDLQQGVDVLDALLKRYDNEDALNAPNAAILPVRAPARKPAGRKQAVRKAGPKAGKKPAGKSSKRRVPAAAARR